MSAHPILSCNACGRQSSGWQNAKQEKAEEAWPGWYAGAEYKRVQSGCRRVQVPQQTHEHHPQVYVLRAVVAGQQAQHVAVHVDGVDGGGDAGTVMEAHLPHVLHQLRRRACVERLRGSQSDLEVLGSDVHGDSVINLRTR